MSHAHEHFRSERVDWARLAERQRERLPLADVWWSLLGAPVGRRIADVGCGPGVLSARYAELGADVLAVDLRADALAHLPRRPRLRPLLHDLERAPLPERVDALLLTDVLHHARDRSKMLEHACASAGLLLVAEFDPEAPGELGPPRSARVGPQDLAALLSAAGSRPRPPVGTAREQYAIVATTG